MFKSYFKTAIRGLFKRKVYATINIVGLASSMAVSLILFTFIQYEESFDGFHTNADSIYRIQQLEYLSDDYSIDKAFWTGKTKNIRKREVTIGVGNYLADLLPEVKQSTRFGSLNMYVQMGGNWKPETLHHADSAFFDMFSFPIKESNVSKPLSRTTDLVVSSTAANRYFGTTDVIGKILSVASSIEGLEEYANKRTETSVYEIVAVVEVPENSSIQFDFLIPTFSINGIAKSSNDSRMMFYSGARYTTFLRLDERADLDLTKQKVDDNLRNSYSEAIPIYRERRKLLEENPVMSFELSPLEAVRFETEVENTFLKTRSALYTMILFFIGILILVIVSINCVTLNLGTLGLRGNEFGMRKAMGAQRVHLAHQFYIEAILQLAIASILALTLTQFFVPIFNGLTNSTISVFGQLDTFLLTGLCIFIMLSLALSLYPLLITLRFRVSEQLNGWSTYKVKPKVIKAIIGFQFAVSVFLFVLVINMNSQFQYLLRKDMGFDKEQVVLAEGLRGGAATFKAELAKSPLIGSVSLTKSSLFTPSLFSIFWNPPNDRSTTHSVFISTVDENFLKTLDIKLVDGRAVQNSEFDLRSSILINESLDKLLKESGDSTRKFDRKNIVGVIGDFNNQGLTHAISPAAFHFSSSDKGKFDNAYIKIEGGDVQGAMEKIEEAWNTVYPNRAVNLRFLDDRIEQEYESYGNTIGVISFLSFLALLLTFMGLFGLMSILIINKFKEIGIRKIFGAKSLEIYLLLSRDFAIMVMLVSIIVAYPGFLIIENWLENFAYSENRFVMLFVSGVMTVTVLCMIVVSFHTVKTSRLSPIKFIKH